MSKGSFRRSLLGYSRRQVEEDLAERSERLARLEREAGRLALRLHDRERRLGEALTRLEAVEREAGRSPRLISGLARRLEEVRGEVGRLLAEAVEGAGRTVNGTGASAVSGAGGADAAGDDRLLAEAGGGEEGAGERFEGEVEVDVGPLSDFAQLSGFEDAAAQIGAAEEIRVRRFSKGRATLSMSLSEPVELLRELEERAPLEFRVRDLRRDRLVIDVDEE